MHIHTRTVVANMIQITSDTTQYNFTHTHAHTHIFTHAHEHTRIYTYTVADAHAYIHTGWQTSYWCNVTQLSLFHTHTHTCTHNTHTHSLSLTHTHTHRHIHTRWQTWYSLEATRLNTAPQHTATHYDTLQRTATLETTRLNAIGSYFSIWERTMWGLFGQNKDKQRPNHVQWQLFERQMVQRKGRKNGAKRIRKKTKGKK